MALKLILFLVIIVVIYFLASKIKIIHADTLSHQEKKELDDRNKIRSLLMSNHIRCANPTTNQNVVEKFDQSNTMTSTSEYSINTESNHKLDADEILEIIRNKFLDRQYFFNMATLPVTMRYANTNVRGKYIKHIKNNIGKWNKVLSSLGSEQIEPIEIKPIYIEETEDEFVILANVKLLFLNKTLHLQLTYYGKIEKPDDFLNGDIDIYVLQLVGIKPISKNEFGQNNYTGIPMEPFMSMDEQMAYVNKINKMHANEEIYY
jgi:hypothetical protein